ncbi:MAG: hypothetical protein ACFFDF_23395 [Candidatus Odinarchaeota archaeon]
MSKIKLKRNFAILIWASCFIKDLRENSLRLKDVPSYICSLFRVVFCRMKYIKLIDKEKEKEFLEKVLRKYPKEWYRCAKCGNIYKKGVYDEESAKEYKENFPNDPDIEGDCVLICDDCYKPLKSWLDKLTPEEREDIEFEEELGKVKLEFANKILKGNE